jgi:hypothetical protein
MFRPEGSQINIEDALTQYEYVQTACNHVLLVEVAKIVDNGDRKT